MKTSTKAIALISVIALAAVAGVLIMELQSVVSADNVAAVGQEENTPSPSAVTQPNNALNDNGGFMGFRGGPRGPEGRFGGSMGRCGPGGFGALQVSEDYIANVTNIAKADSDVQNLLNNGYNITMVRPLISTTVDGNGNVVTKASTAELTLIGTNGRALVLVNLDQAKVTRIVTTTVTQIDK
jgi:hypothetical protein